MKKVVYKYSLEFEDLQEITFPASFIPLCVQAQGDKPQLWALVVPDSLPKRKLRIMIVGTGKEFDITPYWEYFGTFQLFEGRAVFHVFIDREVRG